MLAMRLKRLEIKSQVEDDGVGPVLSSASSSGASGGGASRPAHIRKIELLLEELVPLLPRGRKVRVLDLCNGESTLLEVMMLYLPSICQRFEYVSIDSNPDVDNGALFPGHIHIYMWRRAQLETAAGRCWGAFPHDTPGLDTRPRRRYFR